MRAHIVKPEEELADALIMADGSGVSITLRESELDASPFGRQRWIVHKLCEAGVPAYLDPKMMDAKVRRGRLNWQQVFFYGKTGRSIDTGLKITWIL